MKRHTTFATTRRMLAAGSTSCERVTEGYLEAMEKGKHLHAFLSLFNERAMARARAVDQKLAAGSAGRLAGLVIAVKDVICMKDGKVTCASRMLERFVSPYDATVVQRLEQEDAIIVGKTNMDEFAMGSSGENSAFGPALNPVDTTRVPGGSSSGSCVAVAAGMVHAALGTDTGGSIRQPAAFCGVVGLKPTYGRVSRYGLVALASSFDQIGPFTNSVADSASVLNVIAGHDPADATSAAVAVPDYASSLTQDVRGLRVGFPREVLSDGVQPEIRESMERMAGLLRAGGATVSDVTLPHSSYAVSTYYILMTAEASSNLARYDGAQYGYRSSQARDLRQTYAMSRSEGFGEETKRRIMLGTYALSAGYYDAYYRKAQKVRRLIQDDFIQAFQHVDCLLMPTTPTTAFRLGEKVDDPLQMYLSDVFTVPANLAGLPAISIPCGEDHAGLPMGAQVIGRHFDESTILKVADYLEHSQS